jgi:RNA polymerase primary sigma factor
MLNREKVVGIEADFDAEIGIDSSEPSINELMAMEAQDLEDEDDGIEQLMKLKDAEVFEGNKDIYLMYMRDARRYPRLSREDVIELAKRRDVGERASWEWLVCCNLLLVVKCARRYIGLGLDLHELIQEGNIGLMKAVDGFKHELGFMFSTYAQWHIRRTITRAITDKGNTIRLPSHRMNLVIKYRKLQREHLMRDGEELQDELAIKEMKISVEVLAEIKADIAQMHSKSLNSAVGEDDAEFGDFIKDENSLNFEFDLDNEKMRKIIETFSLYEQVIIRYRFVGGIPSDKIAERFGIPPWQMPKLERAVKFLAIKKLKAFLK